MNILHSLCVRCGFWWFLPWDGWEMYKILNIHVSLLSFCHKTTPARRVSPSWYVYMANCYPGWVIKAGDKRRRTTETLRHLSDTFYAKVEKHLTFINQNIVKSTSNDLLAKQELSVTAKDLPITTLKTSCVYFLLTIHKPNNQGWLNVSACSCPPNLFPAIQTKLWHLSSTLYLFTLKTGNCTWNYSWF